jgi:hypothetical protein
LAHRRIQTPRLLLLPARVLIHELLLALLLLLLPLLLLPILALLPLILHLLRRLRVSILRHASEDR